MTTTVTVQTHGKAAEVETIDRIGQSVTGYIQRIEPESTHAFHVTDTRTITVSEPGATASAPTPGA